MQSLICSHAETFDHPTLVAVQRMCFNSLNRETLFRLLIFPLLSHRRNVDIASFCFTENTLRLSDDGRVNHLAIQRPCSSSLFLSFPVRCHYSNSPLQLVFARSKGSLNSLYLARMDALLAVEAEPFPSKALFFQSLLAFCALV